MNLVKVFLEEKLIGIKTLLGLVLITIKFLDSSRFAESFVIKLDRLIVFKNITISSSLSN